ncbi:LysM peptidoglycan-binding domain-containing protein [Patulibacter minatonensis]|uniref:LysM peptidoglycan-binding domain-containing protein n=1 Tax=Patulibacter minatonensis TaxID=298163 RepID=UPI00047EAA10|nr:LysM domain-containing protein [Patulibacter minatonensis]
MPPRSKFRILPALVLIAVVVAVWLVVQPHTQEPTARPAAEVTEQRDTQPKRRTYTVRQGDSLSSVAQRYRITVDRLIELNPRVDPQAIHRGQRLRLRD